MCLAIGPAQRQGILWWQRMKEKLRLGDSPLLRMAVGGQNCGGWASPNCHKLGLVQLTLCDHFCRRGPHIGCSVSSWHFQFLHTSQKHEDNFLCWSRGFLNLTVQHSEFGERQGGDQRKMQSSVKKEVQSCFCRGSLPPLLVIFLCHKLY